MGLGWQWLIVNFPISSSYWTGKTLTMSPFINKQSVDLSKSKKKPRTLRAVHLSQLDWPLFFHKTDGPTNDERQKTEHMSSKDRQVASCSI